MSNKKDAPKDDITSLLPTASLGSPSVDAKPEVIIANALRHQLLTPEDVIIRSISTFQRSYTKDLFSIERREKDDGKSYYYVNTTREGLYDTLPEGIFHQTLKKDAQIDTEAAVEELALHRQEEKAARLFFLPLEQEFYRLQMLAEWQESNILLSTLDRQQYEALIDLWNLPKGLSTYQIIMMLHIIPLLHRVVGDETATANLLGLVMEIPVMVRAYQSTSQRIDDVDLPPLGEFQLGKDSILGNHIEDYHPNYQLIVGPVKKKYITNYLPGGKGSKTLVGLCAFFLPCQSDISMTIEIEQEESGFVLDRDLAGEGYLGYTTYL
ncbi:MAG: type VI secretion system baseplate subunit TssG [Cyclobacteriaceae bacterium]